jgi:hypothetical protein
MLYAGEHEVRYAGAGYPGGYELRRSRHGEIFYVWKQPVPRIDNQILDCVVYLYPSVAAAEAGESAGGTGFLVSIPSEVAENGFYLYAVTNSHVIREAASPVVRLNTKEGGTDIAALSQGDWVRHQDGDDIEACNLVLTNPAVYEYKSISVEMFLTESLVEERDIGPGDDVYMAGRFVTHEGRQRNTPTVRFGNISMMPWEPIRHPRGHDQESFLVETRSLGGYSGSPVFVHVIANVNRPDGQGGLYASGAGGVWLLGVDWGHLPIYEKVKQENKKDEVPEGWMVESNSGQMAVVPAWRLRELLNQEDFVAERERSERTLAMRQESSPVVLDAQKGDAEGTRQPPEVPKPFTQGDFEDALDRVSRPVPPPVPGS